jgi:hypothetical protein
MTDWQHYVRASYDIVSHFEKDVKPELDQTLESYLVHFLARNFTNSDVGQKPVAISLMESMQLDGFRKKQAMAEVGDECLFIYGFEVKKRKWPTDKYYKDMGTMAYGYASIAIRPQDTLYMHLEENFTLMSKVLRNIGTMLK